MDKKKRILYTLVIAILCVCFAVCAFACSNDDEKEEETTEEEETGLLWANGNFVQVSDSSASYPQTPSSWTGTAGSSSSTSELKTPSGTDNVIAGVISVASSSFKSNAATYGNASNPDKVGKDDKILMIYNKVATSYYYKSSSTSLSKDTYYKLTFSVKTVNIYPETDGKAYGAYVHITGDAYLDFEAIDTQGDWKEYTVYFRGSNSANKTIYLSLGLGDGNSKIGNLTKGWAFFDNVVLEDLTNVEEGETAYTDAKFNALEESAQLRKYDLSYVDPNFNGISNAATATSETFTPAQFNGAAGTGSGDNASTSSSFLEKGIMDIAKAGSTYSFPTDITTSRTIELKTAPANQFAGNKLLYIYNKKATAYVYTDTLGFKVESTKYYKVSIYAKAVTDNGNAYIKLSNGSEVISSLTVDTDGVTDNNGYRQYSFYIAANQYEDNTLYLQLCLGYGGKGDGTWATGVAFFDSVSYSAIEKDVYDAATAGADIAKYSYLENEDDSSIISLADPLFKSTVTDEDFLSDKDNPESLIYSSYDYAGTPVFKTSGASEPNIPVVQLKNRVAASASISTVYESTTVDNAAAYSELFTVPANTAILMTFWVKTVDIASDKSATITVFSYDDAKSADYKNCKTTLTTISVNSEKLNSYANENQDNYVRISVYVLGASVGTKQIGLTLSLGTATTTTDTTNAVAGTLYFTNLRIQDAKYSDYSSASTSDVVYKYSFAGSGSSGEVSSNGQFTYVDISATNTLYGDNASAWENAKLVNTAVPSNWTVTNSKELVQNDNGHSMSGAINLVDFTQWSELSVDSSLTIANKEDVLAGLDTVTSVDEYLKSYPNVLLIQAVDTPSLGYKSTSISLSANSYYVFSVYARDLKGEFAIDIAPSTNTNKLETATVHTFTEVGSDWHQYFVFIKTGINAQTVYVTLYASDPSNEQSANSTVLFTNATYATITEDIFNSAKSAEATNKYISTQTWLTDAMDEFTTSETTLATPANWTGSTVDSSSSTDTDSLAKGIFSKETGDWNLINIDPDTTDSYADVIYDKNEQIGDNVLVVYNKKATTYKYTSTSITMKADSYYKISAQILVKDLAYLSEDDIDSSDSKYDDYKNKNLLPTATATLKANNKTYTFGQYIAKDQTLANFDNNQESYNEYLLKKDRLINATEPAKWVTYTWYISLDKDIEEDVSTTISFSLGGKNVSYWMSGYMFIDNFEVEELTETQWADTTVVPADEAYTYGADTYNKDVASKTYKITYTVDDAKAEEEAEEEEENNNNNTQDEEQKNFVWLYITSGVLAVLVIAAVATVLYRKYGKKKVKKIKKASVTKITEKNSSRDKFKD